MQQFGNAYRQLTQMAQHTDPSTRNRLLQSLASGLTARQSNWEFGSLANTCGMIVEWGADPSLAIEPILDRMTKQLARIPEFVQVMQENLGVEHPNRVAEQDWPELGRTQPEYAWVIGEWHALRFTGCAAMTMLCRDVAARQRARQRVELALHAETARSDNPYAYYLAELLGMADEVRLLVLDTTRGLGFRVCLMAIRNNFHFFTLLQDALLSHASAAAWQGPGVRPLLINVAKGERMLPDIAAGEWAAVAIPDDQRVCDFALWTYCTHRALRGDGTLAGLNASKDENVWIWGEAKPAEIPSLCGERIVLLGAPEFPRSWDLAFFAPLHSALRSSVVVEETLRDEEYRAWIGKIIEQAPP